MRALVMLTMALVGVILIIGSLAFGLHSENSRLRAEGEPAVTFGAFVSGLAASVPLLQPAPPDDPADRVPSPGLLAAMPAAFGDWQARPTLTSDADLFDLVTPLAPEQVELAMGEQMPPPGAEAGRMAAFFMPQPGEGLEDARLTYTGSGGAVVILLERWPDGIFDSVLFPNEKFRLREEGSVPMGTDFLETRGLLVREERLVQLAGVRAFRAHIDGQLHLRVLASSTLSDRALADLLSGLDATGLNGMVVSPDPLIEDGRPEILFSDLVAAEAAAEAERRAANKAKLEAEVAALAAASSADAAGTSAGGKEGEAESGVTVRRGAGGGDCAQVSGFKSCAVVAPD